MSTHVQTSFGHMQVIVSGLQPHFLVAHLAHHGISLPNVFFEVSNLPYDLSSVSKTKSQNSSNNSNNSNQNEVSSAMFKYVARYKTPSHSLVFKPHLCNQPSTSITTSLVY